MELKDSVRVAFIMFNILIDIWTGSQPLNPMHIFLCFSKLISLNIFRCASWFCDTRQHATVLSSRCCWPFFPDLRLFNLGDLLKSKKIYYAKSLNYIHLDITTISWDETLVSQYKTLANGIACKPCTKITTPSNRADAMHWWKD